MLFLKGLQHVPLTSPRCSSIPCYTVPVFLMSLLFTFLKLNVRLFRPQRLKKKSTITKNTKYLKSILILVSLFAEIIHSAYVSSYDQLLKNITTYSSFTFFFVMWNSCGQTVCVCFGVWRSAVTPIINTFLAWYATNPYPIVEQQFEYWLIFFVIII